MSNTDLGVVDQRFIAFLRATLGMMAGTNIIDREIIDLEFWSSWPRKFYNVRSYDSSKDSEDDPDLDDDDDDDAAVVPYDHEIGSTATKKRSKVIKNIITMLLLNDKKTFSFYSFKETRTQNK